MPLPHTEKSEVVWASARSSNFVQVILTAAHMTLTLGNFMQIYDDVGDVRASYISLQLPNICFASHN